MAAGEPRDSGAFVRQGMALHRAQRLREALQHYQQALLLAPEDPDALTYSAAALLTLGKPREAVPRLRASLGVRPKHVQSMGLLGNALHLSGDVAGSERVYREAMALSPRDAWLRNNLGVLLTSQKRPAEAAQCFEEAIAIDPRYADGANNLSHACQQLGQHDRAIAASKIAIEQNPQAPTYHNCLGNALAQCGRHAEAVLAYRQAVALRPAYVDALNNMAVAQVACGQFADAIATTERCTAASPGDVTALATRSVALNELGNGPGHAALVDVDRLLQRFPIVPGPDYGSLAAFNGALAQHVSQHPSLEMAPPDHATRNGKHSGDLLREPRGPIAALQRHIAACCERYLAALPEGFHHPFLDRRPKQWSLDIWAVIMERQGHQVSHIHPSGWLSGVYYVQVEDAVAATGHDGWIEFGRPQTIYRSKAEPRVTLVRPVEGEMLLFPSFFFHRTIAFDAAAERICIAFDLHPPQHGGESTG